MLVLSLPKNSTKRLADSLLLLHMLASFFTSQMDCQAQTCSAKKTVSSLKNC